MDPVETGLAWYAYPMLRRQDASLGELRDEIRDRINQVQAKAADTSSEQDSLPGDAAKLGRDLRARIDAIGKRASQVTEDAYSRLEARLDAEVKSRTQNVANLTGRVSNLEAARAERAGAGGLLRFAGRPEARTGDRQGGQEFGDRLLAAAGRGSANGAESGCSRRRLAGKF